MSYKSYNVWLLGETQDKLELEGILGFLVMKGYTAGPAATSHEIVYKHPDSPSVIAAIRLMREETVDANGDSTTVDAACVYRDVVNACKKCRAKHMGIIVSASGDATWSFSNRSIARESEEEEKKRDDDLKKVN